MGPPAPYRLLLRLFPGWFREEFGAELLEHLAHQRTEARYRGSLLGPARFWWDVGIDALVTSAKLRLGRARAGKGRGRMGGGDHGPTGRGGVGNMVEAITRDVRHALRALTRRPGYAAVFILTLGLGIGANTAMFSAVNGVLLKPLPHEEGDRLVYLRQSARLPGMENVLFSVPEIQDYRRKASSLGAVAEFSAMPFTMLGFDQPRRIQAGIVTGNYFQVMGLSATLGRTVGPEDDGPDAPAVIVLSDAYWRSAFGADPEIIGKTVEVNGRTATFVGVAEPSPPYPERTDVYVNMATSPHHLDATMTHDRIHRMTEVFARLSPGATVESARAEAAGIASRLQSEYPEAYDAGSGFEVAVTPLKSQLTTRARPTLLLLLGTTFLVLVIACANLANLTLTRVLGRNQEMAIRTSLGANRWALRRELLIESLVLSLAGAALGVLMALVTLDLLVSFAGRFTPRASEIALDPSVFAFALLLALAASVFFTVLPSLPDGDAVGGGLTRSGSRSTGGSGAKRVQRALVVAQIGTSFVLLVGAGLLLRTMMHLNRVDPGFDTEQVLAMSVPPNAAGRTDAQIRARYLAILDDVAALPGVERAALTNAVPLRGGGTSQWQIDVQGHEPAAGAPTPRARFRVVSPGYFATMGIDVVRGREFTTTDTEDGQKVVVINQSLASAYFGEGDPIGQQIAWSDGIVRFIGMNQEMRTVVGVVADTRENGLDAEVVHTMYNPYRQVTPQLTGALVLRVRGDPTGVISAVREEILAHDPNQPIENVATLAEVSTQSVASRRLNTMLLGGFALLALVIAAVGIGGVLAFSVGYRKREFGVRSALGAAPHQIWSRVLGEGILLAALGIVLGSITAVGTARLISRLLFGVPALDPVTFVAVGLLLFGVTMAAAWMPAWRAARVSPLEALVSE